MKAHERFFEPGLWLYEPRRSCRQRGPLPLPDLLHSCRCPRCRKPLVIRQGPRRPYFHCGCPVPPS